MGCTVCHIVVYSSVYITAIICNCASAFFVVDGIYAPRDVWGKLDRKFADQGQHHAVYGWIRNDVRILTKLTVYSYN